MVISILLYSQIVLTISPKSKRTRDKKEHSLILNSHCNEQVLLDFVTFSFLPENLNF